MRARLLVSAFDKPATLLTFLTPASSDQTFLVDVNLLESTPNDALKSAIVFPLYDVCQTTPILALRIVLANLLSVGTA